MTLCSRSHSITASGVALDVHAQLLGGDELGLLGLQAPDHLLGQRVVGLLQARALDLELARERGLVLARGQRVDERPVQLLVHVGQHARQQQDGPRHEPLHAVAREAEREREGHEAHEGRDLEGVRVRGVVAHRPGDEERDQHHHGHALGEVRGIGQQEGRDRGPAERGEEGAGEEVALPAAQVRRGRIAVDEYLVEGVAADGDDRDGREPGEERGLREVLPQHRPEDEHHEQGGEVAHQGEAEEEPDLLLADGADGHRRRGGGLSGHSWRVVGSHPAPARE
ncbi:MAG: hypothetical protein KIS74_04110 [Burkholderiales bacterium]|nr:hypothetical protein [Burkholderiales bacterium]